LAVCKFCGKEKTGASSCIESFIVIEKKKYGPIPYKKAGSIFTKKKPEVFLQKNKIKSDVQTAILNPEDIITLDAAWKYVPNVTEDGFSADARE